MSPNSALYWLPRIQVVPRLSLLVPRTEVIHYSHAEAVSDFEGGESYTEWPNVMRDVTAASERLGYPAFIRTDLASAKHWGPSSYLASQPDEVQQVLSSTVEDNEIKFWMTPDTPAAFLVREFLVLDATFTAFGGLPIAHEWRFFATPNEVLCAHPYWPEEVFDEDDVEGWRESLATLHERPAAEEWDALNRLAVLAAGACPDAPAWSVDFAKDKAGKWWLIDMAVAVQSWHWPSCERRMQDTRA